MRKPVLNFTLDQVRCLTSPLRTELLYAWLVDGPMTVKELASVVVRPSKSLYYQVRLLEQNGLIERVGSRLSGKRFESIYDAVADNMVVQSPPLSSEYRQEFARNVKSVMANAAAQFGQSVMEAGDDLAEFRPYIARHITFRLTADMREAFMDKLREAMQFARANEDRQNGRRIALTLLVAPTPSHKAV